LKTLLPWLWFPLIFGGAMLGGLLLIGRGFDAYVVAGFNLAAVAVLMPLERIVPYEPRWNESRGDVRTDVLHMLFSTVAMPEVIRALLFGGLAAAGAWLSERAGLGLWPTSWPLLAQWALAMVVSEFGQYWMHRGMHVTSTLWRLHAVHHSAERLYWLNAGRFHPLDTLFNFTLQAGPLILLGAPGEVVALFALFTGVHGLMQHANLDLRLGPLNWVFSMAELHRWHHSRVMDESNSNYGANLIVWDVVFGTRLLPAGKEPPREPGFEGVEAFPTGYLAQLGSPISFFGDNSDGSPE
jgi:ornithine lipid hydroxylase